MEKFKKPAIIAAVTAGALVVASNYESGPEEPPSIYTNHNCKDEGRTVEIRPGDTVSERVGRLIAKEIGINDVAGTMPIIEYANPDLDPGQVDPGQKINVPVCEK